MLLGGLDESGGEFLSAHCLTEVLPWSLQNTSATLLALIFVPDLFFDGLLHSMEEEFEFPQTKR